MRIEIFPLADIGEVAPGTDLVSEVIASANGSLREGDVLAATSKVVGGGA
ncbi:hypothetical protein FBY31_4464 [Arthrobacter sp. SLBN-100]|nr:hypothetical protein [Arthrobacter sp. SLBN-100]TQJ62085.1 hypothetical protein FBY31_4464 [Arthrobacter sp. SLBN-100]